jgi:hypothetical protein
MKFFRKYRLQFDIIAILAFAFASWIQFNEYGGPEGEKINLVSGIVFGLMTIIRVVDLIDDLKKKRKKIENSDI